VFYLTTSGVAQQTDGHEYCSAGPEEGTGLAHMDISCSSAVVAKFDRALALLHNFWCSRALEGFQQVLSADPECAMAHWGAAMTYNHPFWDAPSARSGARTRYVRPADHYHTGERGGSARRQSLGQRGWGCYEDEGSRRN
jgi:hypothetical protein